MNDLVFDDRDLHAVLIDDCRGRHDQRRRQRDAVNRRDHLPQPINTIVVELRFVQVIGAEADLQDRNCRGAVLHNDRRPVGSKARIAFVAATICEIARLRFTSGWK